MVHTNIRTRVIVIIKREKGTLLQNTRTVTFARTFNEIDALSSINEWLEFRCQSGDNHIELNSAFESGSRFFDTRSRFVVFNSCVCLS